MRVDLDVAEDEFVSIIGPNGAGKTTLFNLVTGLDEPDAGTVSLEGRDVTGMPPERLAALGVARTFQHGRVFANLTVLDNVLVGAHRALQGGAARLARPARPARADRRAGARPRASRQGEGGGSGAARGGAARSWRRFGERLLPRKDNPAYSLSYANRRRVEIAPRARRSARACCCSTSRPPA